jgi:integrase
VLVESPGCRRSLKFETEGQAIRAGKIAEEEFEKNQSVTIQEAVELYEMYQRETRQVKMQSAVDTAYRLGLLFPQREALVSSLTPERCKVLVEELRKRPTKFGRPFAVDSLKNILAEAKTFATWCVSKTWLKSNPLAGIKIEGKRHHRKPQLRADEARDWSARAMEQAREGDEGALAALVALFMGLRSTEIVKRVVRDLDSDGTILVVEEAKTPAGNRRVRVPIELQPLLRQAAVGKASGDRLFGKHWRDWVRKSVARICKDAGVPVVCAHSMRGLHSSLAMEAGMSPDVVARSLGHESSRTTLESYAHPESVASGRQNRVAAQLLRRPPEQRNRREFRSAIVPQRRLRLPAGHRSP